MENTPKSLTDLLSTNNAKFNKKQLEMAHYQDQTKQLPISTNGFTYPLINVTNRTNIIAEAIYVGHTYFITILPYEIYNTMLKSKINFKLITDKGEQNILDIHTNSNPIETKYFIILFTIEGTHELFTFNIITYENYLSLEKIGNLMYTFSGYTNRSTTVVNSVNNYSIIANTNLILNFGTPLFIDNQLIGIFYRQTETSAFYLRLSTITNWLSTFKLVDVTRDTGFVPFTNQQLYSIIVGLQNRIEILENNAMSSTK
jgi:hypothetical protein